MLLSSQHFGGRGACQSSRIGTRKNDKQINYSHIPTQIKQQVGQCIMKTLLVHKQTTSKHRFTRLTTAWTWGKPPPSPLQCILCLATRLIFKCHFVSGLRIGTPTILGAHNFVCRPSIKVRFEAKLQPSSKTFQQILVVRSQIANLTPNLSLGHNLCFNYPNGSCELILGIQIPRSFQWYN